MTLRWPLAIRHSTLISVRSSWLFYLFKTPNLDSVMPDWGTYPAKGLFFARFEYIRDFPTPRQSGITALIIIFKVSLSLTTGPLNTLTAVSPVIGWQQKFSSGHVTRIRVTARVLIGPFPGWPDGDFAVNTRGSQRIKIVTDQRPFQNDDWLSEVPTPLNIFNWPSVTGMW